VYCSVYRTLYNVSARVTFLKPYNINTNHPSKLLIKYHIQLDFVGVHFIQRICTRRPGFFPVVPQKNWLQEKIVRGNWSRDFNPSTVDRPSVWFTVDPTDRPPQDTMSAGSLIYVIWMYSMLVTRPMLNCTQVETEGPLTPP
jgi:hypothetical protein